VRPRVFAYALGCVAIFAILLALAPPRAGEGHLRGTVNSIDSSIQAVKLGEIDSAKKALTSAKTHYQNEDLRPKVQAAAQELDDRVMSAFDSLGAAAPEDFKVENLKALRSDVLSASGAAGIWLSPLYQHAALVIVVAAAILALLITLLSKQVIDWPRLKAAREEFKALGKEIMAATRRGDVKQVHKLQPRYRQLSKEVMWASFKQMFLPLISYFVAWHVLPAIYTGWVVAWLPFGPAKWPLFGTVVSVGSFWWFILTYSGFSVVWRQLLIGEW